MKKSVLLLVGLMMMLFVNSQTLVFNENFELPSLADSVISSGNPGWAISTTLASQGLRSDSSRVAQNDTSYLTSIPFSTLGMTGVYLEFSHICKNEFADIAEVWVSNNNGISWVKLLSAQYLGTGQFGTIGNKFSAASYIDWLVGDNNAIPTNAWWKNEKFDIGALVGNSAQARIRFVLADGNISGHVGNYGWLIDNIRVTAAISELDPPVITMNTPIVQDTIFSTGPYTISANITDASGVATARLVYWVNLGLPDTLIMTKTTGNTYVEEIPSFTYGNKITYYIFAIDSAAAANKGQTSNYWFFIKKGLIPGVNIAPLAIASASPACNTGPCSTLNDLNFGTCGTQQMWITSSASNPGSAVNITFVWPKTYTINKMTIHVAESSTRFLTGGTVQIWNGSIWVNHHAFTQAIGVCYYDINFSVVTTSQLRIIDMTVGGSQTSNANFREIEIFEVPPPPIPFAFDAGVSHLVEPPALLYNTNPVPIKVRIKNFSGDTLKKVTINWSANGFLKTPFNWTGNLLYDQVSHIINIGSEAFATGSYDLKFWTALPNDSADQQNSNDTLNKIINVCGGLLSGSYSIGGTGANFSSFNSAYTQMRICGIGGPVVFNVNPGTYNEQLTWRPVPGASIVNIITFKSTNNDSTSVILNYAPLGTADNWTIRLDSADYFRFEKMTIQSTGALNGRVVEFINGADYNEFSNNIIRTKDTTTTTFAGFWAASTSNNNFNIIKNNRIVNGYYSVYLYGTTAYSKGNMILNNIIQNHYYYGVFVYYQDSVFVTGNTLTNLFAKTINYSIYGLYLRNKSKIDNNKIFVNTSGTNLNSAIYGSNLIDFSASFNEIKLLGGGTIYGIYAGTVTLGGRFENNIITTDQMGTGTTYGIWLPTIATPVVSKNQITCNGGAGTTYGIFASTVTVAGSFNKNKVVASSTGTLGGLWFSTVTGVVGDPVNVFNNFVTVTGGTANTAHGIYSTGANHTNFSNNSVNCVSGSATAGNAFYQTGGSFITIRNNIFANFNNGYSIYVVTPTAVVSSDYNNLFTTGTNLGFWTANRTDLAAWKTASLKDTNSVSVNPVFASLTDLHINNVLLDGKATPILSVTDDIDNQARDLIAPDIGADEFSPVLNDAGITALISPVAPCPSSVEPIRVRVKNYGTIPLVTVTLNWQVNGITQTSFNSTDTIQPNQEKVIQIGTFTFLPTLNYTLKAWPTLPNGGLDGNPLNDTLLHQNLKTAMPGGIFTIGGTGATYPTFASAVSAISANGICGPVVFNVNAGTYNEQVTIPEILGASAINTITFQSTTGDSTSVIINYAPMGTGDNWTLRFHGADYVTFRRMTILSSGVSNGYAVEFINTANYNKLENNIIQTVVSTSTAFAGIWSTTSNDNYNIIRNNRIVNGYYGIYWYGNAATSREVGNIIENNIFSNYYYYAIFIYNQDSLQVIGNTIRRLNAPTANYGIYPVNCYSSSFSRNLIDIHTSTTSAIYGLYPVTCQNIDIHQNDINLTSPSGAVYGLYVSSLTNSGRITRNNVRVNSTTTAAAFYGTTLTGTSTNPVTIANNLFSQVGGTTNTAYGIYISSGTFANFYYNSANVSGGSLTAGYAFYSTSGSTMNLVNNIFSNPRGGYSIYVATTAAIGTSNTNNFFTTGTNLGFWTANRANLAAWQAASLKDSNSISVNPQFYSPTNLHASMLALNAAAVPIPGITIDYDGETRDATNPDIGADEFSPAGEDIGVLSMNTGLSVCPTTPQNISVRVKNYGFNTIYTGNVHWQVNGITQPTYAFVDTIQPYAFKDFTIGSFIFNPMTTNTLTFWTSLPNSITDPNTFNDSLKGINVITALRDTLTIGGTSANFPTMASAITALNTFGVCGPVVFSINPGTYTGQITLGIIPGASLTNTVTFTSATGDSTSVILTYAPLGTTDNWTVRLDGSDFIRFRKLTIRSTGATNGRVVELINVADYNEFTNNVIQTSVGTSTALAGFYSESTTTNNFNLIQNNRIVNGYYGIFFNAPTTFSRGNKIIGNLILNHYYYGMYLYYQDSLDVTGNTIQNLAAPTTSYAIIGNNLTGGPKINLNKINVTTIGTSSNYGIYIATGIINPQLNGNEMTLNGGGLVYAIYTSSTTVASSIQNNKINVNATGTGTVYGIYCTTIAAPTITANELMLNAGGGLVYGLYTGTVTSGGMINRNKIFTNSTGTNGGLYMVTITGTAALPVNVQNNFISQVGGTTNTVYGIYASSANYTNFNYNTINVAGGATTGTMGAIYTTGGTFLKIRNNNFINTRGGYAAYYATTTAIDSCNYNNLFTSGANIGFWTTARTNLAAWRLASLKDTNSVSVPVKFVSASDLHVKSGGGINGKAIPIAGINIDIDGQTRDSITPDIGADEFTPPLDEVEIVAMYTLGKLAKNVNNPHRIRVIVENNGLNAQINFPINLNVSGANTIDTTIYIANFTSGRVDTLFLPSYTAVNNGLQTVKVSIPNDFDTTNNVRVYRQEVSDWELSYADTSAIATNLGYNTAGGLLLNKHYINGTKTIAEVRAHITNSNTIGQTVYGVVVNKSGTILATSANKVITATDVNTRVSFPINNIAATTTTNDSLFVGLAQVANATSGYFPLGVQTEVPARYEAFYGSAITGGALTEYKQFGRFVIEAVGFPPLSKDVAAVELVNPKTGCGLGSETISLKIINQGIDTIFGGSNVLTVGYRLDSTSIVVIETVSDTILPGNFYTHTFAAPLNMTSNVKDSSYYFKGFAKLLSDPFVNNDTTALIKVTSKKTPLPPLVSNVSIPYGTATLLTAISPDSVLWYKTDTSTVKFHQGSTYQTPILTDTTTYFVTSGGGSGPEQILNVGTQTSIYNASQVRGYYFKAPIDMTITELMVPTTVNVGPQYIQVVKFIGPPVIYSGTSQHVDLAYIANAPFGVPQVVNIPVAMNDYIGILGATNSTGTTMSNSYGPALVPSSIDGNPVTLTRILYQGTIISGPAPNNSISEETNASIARIEMKYKAGAGGCPSTKVPITVFITGIPFKNAAADSLKLPVSGCNMGNKQISMRISNPGIDSINGNLTANYRINNSLTFVTENVTSIIPPKGFINYTFSTPVNFSSPNIDSTYNIKAWVDLVGDTYKPNDTTIASVVAKLTPADPVVSNVTIPYATKATLTASSNAKVFWYNDSISPNHIDTGATFITPVLFDTTTYYVEAKAGSSASGVNIAPLATASASTCNTGPCSTLNDLNYGTCGTQQMWISTTTPPNSTPHVEWMDFTWTSPVSINKMTIHHAQDNARFLTGATMYSWNGTAWISFHTFSNLPMQCINTVNFPTVTTTRLRLTSFQMTGTGQLSNPNFREIEIFNVATGCSSNRVPVKVTVTGIAAVDAGAEAIVSPSGSVLSNTPVPTSVRIKNYGLDSLKTAIINWSINGILQTPVPWSGALAKSQISTVIALGNGLYKVGNNVIQAWTSMPNGIADLYAVNDTASSTVLGCISGGTFTIGGVSADFPTISSALAVLTCTITSPVIFNINPGTYTGQITIPFINGVSATNTITFQSAIGDSTSVILTYAPVSAADNWTVRLDSAKFIKFNKLTLRSTSTTAGYVVVYAKNASNNEFSNNVVQTSVSTSTTFAGFFSPSATNNNSNVIRNNRIVNGYYGIYMYGISSTDMAKKNIIEGNTIENFYYYGIYSYNQDSTSIKNNIIRNVSPLTVNYCIYAYALNSRPEISGNTINIVSAPSTVYGIYTYMPQNAQIMNNNITISSAGTVYAIYTSTFNNGGRIAKNKIIVNNSSTNGGIYMEITNGTALAMTQVDNNFISLSGSGANTSYGIYASSCAYTNYYYNSINILNASLTGGYAIYTSSGSFINIVNNNIANQSGGYVMYIATPTAIASSNYNNMFTNGTNIGYWNANITNLAAWKTASNQDANSISVMPMYISTTDLHTQSFQLNGNATPIVGILDDIDGDIRNVTTPDIGADEFTPPANDAGVLAITSPVSPITIGIQNIVVSIMNYGMNNLTSANINYSINGGVTLSYAWNGNVVTGFTATGITIGTFNFVAGANTIKVWTSLPNGQPDGGTYNDTLQVSVIACVGPLSGTYTIGATGNYPNVITAVEALSFCGISGPVTFNIASGTYTGQVTIPEINGASAINTITFRPATGATVLISNNSSTATIRLNGADNVIFDGSNNASTSRNMTIANTSAAANTAAIWVSSLGTLLGSTDNTIKNCNIIAGDNNITSTFGIHIGGTAISTTATGADNDNITISNNHIQRAYIGIYARGSATATSLDNLLITNNLIGSTVSSNSIQFRGLDLGYGLGTVISDNEIFNLKTTSSINNAGIELGAGMANTQIFKNKIYGIYSTSSGGWGAYGININSTVTDNIQIYNNFIYDLITANYSTTSTIYNAFGIRITGGTNHKVYFNTINLYGPVTSGTSTGMSAAFCVTSSTATGLDVRNNIFANSTAFAITGAKSYAAYVVSGTTFAQIDRNDYFASGTNAVLGFYAADKTTLLAWQQTSLKDSNSINVDPLFFAMNNLHITSPSLNAVASPIAGIFDDIDGDLRHLTTPDIGADEFNPVGKDIGVFAFNQPVIKLGAVGTNVTIEVQVRNVGLDTITSFNVHYKVGTAAAVTTSWSGNLFPGTTTNVSFPTPYQVLPGNQNIASYTTLAGDVNLLNDTSKIVYRGIPIVALTFTDNFEGTDNFYTMNSPPLWEKGTPNASIINSAYSPVTSWATNLTGNYTNNAQEYLYTPYFNFSSVTGATMKFWHWYHTETAQDACRIQYTKDGGANWSQLGYVGDPYGGTTWYTNNLAGTHGWSGSSSGWVQAIYDLTDFNNTTTPVQFRFHFFSNASNNSFNGWAIDNFSIALPPVALDASVKSIDQPVSSTVNGSTVTVNVTIKNSGSTTLTSIPVGYRINNNPVVNETWTGSLLMDSVASYTFTTPYTSPNTSYKLCVFTKLPSDQYPLNDTVCANLSVTPAPFDAGITALLEPASQTIFQSHVSVKVRIKNFGTSTLTSIPMEYTFGISGTGSGTWTGSLLANATVDYTFPATYSGPLGVYNLCVRTKLVTDADSTNDKICTSLTGIVGLDELARNGFAVMQNRPNPAKSNTEVDVILNDNGELRFTLVDVLGNEIYRKSSTMSTGTHTLTINLENVAPGIYYYYVDFNNHRVVKKMTVL